MDPRTRKKINELVASPRNLCALYFKDSQDTPINLTPYQEDIVRNIMFKKHKRTLCWATTRAGKSYAVALGLILLSIFSVGEKIRVIAPTVEHTRIIRSYIDEHITDHPMLLAQLDIDTRGMGAERLKREVSKHRLTFKTGSEISLISANIASGGRSLIGAGGSVVVIDEAEMIPSQIIRSKIMRMLGDDSDSMVFMISNPHHKGYMYDNRNKERWHKQRIGWEACVEAGRLSPEFVQERREEMTDIEFKIWYEAEYPEDMEDTLIKREHIDACCLAPPDTQETPKRVLSCDIARYGTDLSVLLYVDEYETYRVVRGIKKYHRQSTMKTVGQISLWNQEIGFDKIIIDDTGVGSGVTDRLQELVGTDRVVPFRFGGAPTTEEGKKRFLNQKAQYYFRLSSLLEHQNIYIPPSLKLKEEGNRLCLELNRIRYEVVDSSGKLKIIDPEKSPDYADALMMAVTDTSSFNISILEDPQGVIF